MTIAEAPIPRDLDAEQLRDIERFEIAIDQFLKGEISDDVFRVMRLNNGIYGQRQGGTTTGPGQRTAPARLLCLLAHGHHHAPVFLIDSCATGRHNATSGWVQTGVQALAKFCR